MKEEVDGKCTYSPPLPRQKRTGIKWHRPLWAKPCQITVLVADPLWERFVSVQSTSAGLTDLKQRGWGLKRLLCGAMSCPPTPERGECIPSGCGGRECGNGRSTHFGPFRIKTGTRWTRSQVANSRERDEQGHWRKTMDRSPPRETRGRITEHKKNKHVLQI